MSLLITKSHRWLSVPIGIQLLIWLGTGLYLSLFSNDGPALKIQKPQGIEWQVYAGKLYPVNQLPVKKAESIQTVLLAGKPVYEVILYSQPHNYQPRQVRLFDAVSGQPFSIDKQWAKAIALERYSGDAALSKIELEQSSGGLLPKQKNAYWSAYFDDSALTYIHIDQQSGRFLTASDEHRRFVALMFKLHFMDYWDTGSFNHPLLIIVAVLALAFGLSGLAWLIMLLKAGRFTVRLGALHKIDVLVANNNQNVTVQGRKNTTLLTTLTQNQLQLPAKCGGGGTCGTCRFYTQSSLPAQPAETHLISHSELAAGCRLACQHAAHSVDSIIVKDMATQALTLQVSRAQYITPTIKEIAFKVTGGNLQKFNAGSSMQFSIPGGKRRTVPVDIPSRWRSYWAQFDAQTVSYKSTTRSYSIANYSGECDELIFTIKWQCNTTTQKSGGAGSSYLCSLAPGESVEAYGPFASFAERAYQPGAKVLIGGGSGIAPLRALIYEALIQNSVSHQMIFIYGARNEEDLCYSDEFEHLAKRFENFTYLPTLSSPSPAWQGHSGYVQQLTRQHLNFDVFNSANFYLCGPAPMLAEVKSLLLSQHIEPQQIYIDSFNTNEVKNESNS
ncbi:2Fe-2S iron-sulfur cluster-binding protein [Salinimonas sediminis]|uniref:Uncharacterized protein n=1 Tax=Salinimonas sediminis TaxID=2303538 RepID=A0A346NNP1_9ALTE|nr:2Fe-2S iron-sulfur cluster-binding protein [Salinimonas sediminis]AXR07148.1 hypothetical protein D0Y50_12800 [Salinimonas sediminis]